MTEPANGAMQLPGATGRWAVLARHPERLLFAVLAWHLAFWVLAPLLAYRMLPLDTLELLGWGQQWQWGYYKHPPLGAWLGEAVLQLSGGWLGSMYLLAQLVVVVALVYVWKTARLVLDPAAAVLATVLLEAAYWYTYLTPNLNMNTLQLPLWAGFSYHLLRATHGDLRHWLACGVFAALCLLAKYSGVLIIASGAIALLATAPGRRCLRQPGPWLGALAALMLLLPHLAWLAEHWRLPLAYLRGFDARAPDGWQQHVLEPLRFAAAALLGLALSVALLAWTRRGSGLPRRPLTDPQRMLLVLCLGPLLLSMLYGALTGSRLKTTWAFPFFNLAGIALLIGWPIAVGSVQLRRFSVGLVLIVAVGAGGHLAYKLASDRSKTAFDGQALADAVTRRWHAVTDAPLRVVAGDHIVTAIVSQYATARPAMLINGDFAISPWLSPDDLRRHGAAFVCPQAAVCFRELRLALGAGDRPAEPVEVSGQLFDLYIAAPAK